MNIFKSTSKLHKKNTELDIKIDSDRSSNNPNDKKQQDNHFNMMENIEKDNVIPENSENESIFFDKEIVVDPNTEINSIQKAVDIAEPHTIIKIQPGVYRENIYIKTPFLELRGENQKDPPVILSDNNPCIVISRELNSKDKIILKNLKLINRGKRKHLALREQDPRENIVYHNSEKFKQLEIQYLMDVNIAEILIEENTDRLSIISIHSGEVSIFDCQFNLSHLTTFTNTVLPAIYCEHSNLNISNVNIVGNNEFLTVGFLVYNCNINLMDCTIQDHRCGGFLSKIEEDNQIIINKCVFTNNSGIALYIKGNGQKIHLEDNNFKKNLGVGVKIIDSSNLSIIGNMFKFNLLNGADLINCDGLIMLNTFKNNKGCGLLLESQNDGIFSAKIFKNLLENNYLSGILIKGENNSAKIYQNKKICKNYLNGIHVSEKATPKIFDNIIDSNLNHGILINSGSSAIVEKNIIFENQKSNVAFGGKLSEKTVISGNKIYGSKNEGIYVCQSSGGTIRKNEIHSNNDGIVISNCNSLDVSENNIYGNIRCGILISSKSNPTLIKNNIHDNDFIGLFIRDQSTGEYLNNEIKKNVSQLYLSKNCSRMYKQIKKENTIEGRVDVSQSCTIF